MPSPFIAVVLVFAAYRLTRLAGWDDFPLAVKIRDLVIGTHWISTVPPEVIRVRLEEGESLTDHVKTAWSSGADPLADIREFAERQVNGPDDLGLPGKQPPSEAVAVRPAYDRPTLAHLIHCPFCVGFWISLATWLTWLAWHPVEYGMMPFAISGAVGLIAKNWDP
jgi:hypothetical protein